MRPRSSATLKLWDALLIIVTTMGIVFFLLSIRDVIRCKRLGGIPVTTVAMPVIVCLDNLHRAEP